MKISVIHAVLCDKGERDPITGKINCIGIAERTVEGFPETISFSLVVWLKGITEANHQLKITLFSPQGTALGEKDYTIDKGNTNNQQDFAEIIFTFNNVTFQSAQESYKIEIRNKGKFLLSKVVGVTLKPRMTPITSCGDRGYVRLS